MFAALTMGVVVGRIDTPGVPGPMMFGVPNAIHDGITQQHVTGCHIDFRPQYVGSVRKFPFTHPPEKIQIGRNLTKGLGAGGDPELGKQAASEAELEIRDALRDRKIIFICVGLGGGTGSGAAPLVARVCHRDTGGVVGRWHRHHAPRYAFPQCSRAAS